MTTKAIREAQILALTEKDREEADSDNPIIYAETAPCHYQSETFWFPEGDSVEVVQNLDWEEDLEVYYQEQGGERVQITEGALYEWAIERWESN